MINIWNNIIRLIENGNIRISEHGYDELAADGITVREIVSGSPSGTILEEYPEYHKGPCALIILKDFEGNPIHAVWGIPRRSEATAVLVTAYRPDPERWEDDFRRRKI
ncbi:MAG: DUF4258 domain-containing protein [Proteobacteria bacterium]|nr:DUF4258 domain-containing protein [Pseudomonadota bacterium]